MVSSEGAALLQHQQLLLQLPLHSWQLQPPTRTHKGGESTTDTTITSFCILQSDHSKIVFSYIHQISRITGAGYLKGQPTSEPAFPKRFKALR